MSIVHLDGFDLYGSLNAFQSRYFLNNASGALIDTDGGRFGGGAIRLFSANRFFTLSLDESLPYVCLGMAFKFVDPLVNSSSLIGVSRTTSTGASGNYHCVARLGSDGTLSLHDQANATVDATASGFLTINNWYYIELRFSRLDAGYAEVLINGSVVLSGNADYRHSLSDLMFAVWGCSGTMDTFIDDVFVASDLSVIPASHGDVKVTTLLPNSDTLQSDWTPLSGSGFSNINDALGTDGDGDTTYISTNTIGHKSEFDMEDLPESPDAILGIQVSGRSKKSDAGLATVRNYIDSNGTEAVGNTYPPSETSYTLHTDVFETDPNTAGAWTEAAVNAVKLGVERDG